MNTKEAISVLINSLNTDSNYRYSWQANIAVHFQDVWQKAANDGGLPATPESIHKISNDAAIRFIEQLCYSTKELDNCKLSTTFSDVPLKNSPLLFTSNTSHHFEMVDCMYKFYINPRTISLVGKNKNECSHTWSSYTGLTEKYDFCTKCDQKRNT